MGIIAKNPRWEAYAQARAMGRTIKEASKVAGFHFGTGARIEKDQRVSDRILELQSEHQAFTGITSDWLTKRLLEDHQLARQQKQPRSAIAALEALGKLHGLIVEKKEIKQGLLDGLAPDTLRQIAGEIDLERTRRAESGDSPDGGSAVH